MSQLVVSARGSDHLLMIKASLSMSLAHTVAEAFTEKFDIEAPLHDLLVRAFGTTKYRWYAADMASTVWKLTFSNLANPPLLSFNKFPAQIVNPDLTLLLQEVDLVRPGRLNPTARHPHYIETST